MIRPSLLPISQHCGLAAVLHESDPTASGRRALIGSAYHALVADNKPEASRLLDLLTEPEREELASLVIPTDIPPNATRERRLGLSPTGGVTEPGTPGNLTEGTADAFWHDTSHKGNVACVVDYKTGERDNREGVEDGSLSLQLVAYGFMVASLLKADEMVLGIWYARRGVYDWSGAIPLDSPQAAELWRRVVAAATKEPKAEVGPQCETCWQRHRCPARLLPAIDGTAIESLEPFIQGGQALTPATAAKGIQVIAAMREVADRAEEQIRAEVASGRLVLVQDGKVYGPSEVQGRSSADVEALLRDGLGKYVKQGRPYLRWGWRKS